MGDVSSILTSQKYLSFKHSDITTLKNNIINTQSKKSNTDYEEKIKRVVHNFVQSSSIEHKLKNMIIMEYNPKYHVYKKLYKQFLDRYGFYLSDFELQELLKTFHPDFANYMQMNKNDLDILINEYEKNIKNIIDASASLLNIESLELLFTSFEYASNPDGTIKFNKIFRYTESDIYLDILYILQLENFKYSIEGRLTNMNIFTRTHYWNQIAIYLCYEITKTEPVFYNNDQKYNYTLFKNKLNHISDFIEELKFLYRKEKITLINYIYLLIMKYHALEVKTKTNLHHFIEDEYVHRITSDIELYDETLYHQLKLSDKTNKESFIDELRIIFNTIKPSLKFPMSYEQLKNIAETFLERSLDIQTYDKYINTNVPYLTMIHNMMRFNREHLHHINCIHPIDIRENIYSIQDIFLDIYSWNNIINFQLETYFDYLFLNTDLNIIHKYILAMKGVLYFPIGDDIIKYITRNISYLIGEKYDNLVLNKKYKDSIEIKTVWNNNIIKSIIEKSENIFIYPLIQTHAQNLHQFVDFIAYYLILSGQSPTYEIIQNRIKNYTTFTNLNDLENIVEEIMIYIPEHKNVRDQSLIRNNETTNAVHKLNGVYSLHLEQNILFQDRLFTPSQSFHDFIFQEIFKNNEIGISGEILVGLGVTGGTGATGTTDNIDSSLILNNLIRETKIFYSMNFDKDIFDHELLSSDDLSLTSKMIYSVFTRPQNVLDISNNFGIHISNYVSTRRMSNQIWSDIYHLIDKVSPFALMYLIVEYSISSTLSSKEVGKSYPFDIVSNIRLNEDDYLEKIKTNILTFHPNLAVYMERNKRLGSKVITMSIYDRLFLDYYNTLEVYDFFTLYEKNKRTNIQLINILNYTYFIEQFIEQDIKNPYDLLMFVSQFNYDVNIMDVIRETIKKNYSQYLSKYFYYDWVYSYKDNVNDDFNSIVYYTLGKLMEYTIMTEDEFFGLMSVNPDDTLTLFLNTKVYYTFKKDPNEYFIQSGENKESIPKINTSGKLENMIDLIQSMNFDNMRIPTQDMMKRLIEQKPDIDIRRTEEEIQKELNSLPKDEVKNEEDTPANNEALEKKYIQRKDVQSMFEYLKEQGRKRGVDINSKVNSFMTGMMILQLWISMFDPTQVLSDYMFERLMNQGVLGSCINTSRKDNSNLDMSLTTYPSSLVAKLMYENLVELLTRQGIPITRDNLVNKLQNWTDDEKWEIESTAFIMGKQFLSFIHNNNTIRYTGSPNIGIKSNIKPVTFEKAKLVVHDGGSGLLELRKI